MALSWKPRSKHLAKKSDERKIGTADDPTVDRARAPDFSEALSLNPLFAHSAAAMAAATAIGFGFANQMASAFFGALQGALETAGQKSTEKQAEASRTVEAPEAPASAAGLAVDAPSVAKTSGVAPEKPKAKPARKPAAQKKTAAKPVQPEAPVVKAKKAVTGKPAAVSGADDLKRISGIGPKLEAVLKGLGVTSVSQIAAWKDADITRFDKELGFEGRIKRDDWVGQAKALLK